MGQAGEENAGDAIEETDTPPAEDDGVTQLERVITVLETYCGDCHGTRARASGNVMGNLGYIDDLERLAEEGYVIPLGGGRSEIVVLMRSGSMPPRGASLRPSRADIQTIVDYIDAVPYW